MIRYKITILPSEVLEREWKTRKTSEVKEARKCKQLSKPVGVETLQQTNHSHNAICESGSRETEAIG